MPAAASVADLAMIVGHISVHCTVLHVADGPPFARARLPFTLGSLVPRAREVTCPEETNVR